MSPLTMLTGDKTFNRHQDHYLHVLDQMQTRLSSSILPSNGFFSQKFDDMLRLNFLFLSTYDNSCFKGLITCQNSS